MIRIRTRCQQASASCVQLRGGVGCSHACKLDGKLGVVPSVYGLAHLSMTPNIHVSAMQSPMMTKIATITVPILSSVFTLPPHPMPMSGKIRGIPHPNELTRKPTNELSPVNMEPYRRWPRLKQWTTSHLHQRREGYGDAPGDYYQRHPTYSGCDKLFVLPPHPRHAPSEIRSKHLGKKTTQKDEPKKADEG